MGRLGGIPSLYGHTFLIWGASVAYRLDHDEDAVQPHAREAHHAEAEREDGEDAGVRPPARAELRKAALRGETANMSESEPSIVKTWKGCGSGSVSPPACTTTCTNPLVALSPTTADARGSS